MAILDDVREARTRLSEFVAQTFPRLVGHQLSREEMTLAVHLRGNDALRAALCAIVENRIKQRALVPEPRDPIVCKSAIARDRELQWLLGRIEAIYRSPVNQEDKEGEPPA